MITADARSATSGLLRRRTQEIGPGRFVEREAEPGDSVEEGTEAFFGSSAPPTNEQTGRKHPLFQRSGIDAW